MRGHKHHSRQIAAIRNLFQHSKSVGTRDLHVQENQIWFELPDHFSGANAIAAFADNPHLRVGLNQRAQPPPRRGFVIDHQRGNFHRRFILHEHGRPRQKGTAIPR